MVIDTNEIARSLSTYAPLRPVIKRIGPPPSRRARPSAGRFPRVVEAIVYQQLAGRAASVIHGRLVEATGKKVTPESVLALSDDQCATIGLSRGKRDARDFGVVGECRYNLLIKIVKRKWHGVRLTDAPTISTVYGQ